MLYEGAGRSSASTSTRSTPTSSDPTFATTNRPHMPTRYAVAPTSGVRVGGDASDVFEPFEQPRTVRLGHPWHVRGGVVVDDRAPSCKHSFRGGAATDRRSAEHTSA